MYVHLFPPPCKQGNSFKRFSIWWDGVILSVCWTMIPRPVLQRFFSRDVFCLQHSVDLNKSRGQHPPPSKGSSLDNLIIVLLSRFLLYYYYYSNLMDSQCFHWIYSYNDLTVVLAESACIYYLILPLSLCLEASAPEGFYKPNKQLCAIFIAIHSYYIRCY